MTVVTSGEQTNGENESEARARERCQVRPALRTESFFAALDRSRAFRRNPKGGGITLVGAGRILDAFPDEFRLAGRSR